MTERLKNSTAIITGGTSGIGEACAYLFAREGASVAVAGRNEERGSTVATTITKEGGNAIFIKTDVTHREDIINLVATTMDRFQKIDVLINNAGIGDTTPLHLLDEEQWDKMIDTNLKSMFLCSKHVIPHMLKQKKGSIINMSSILGLVGFSGANAYSASKGGSRLLTRTMALDYAKDGIRVNAICPGFIRTPMVEKGLDEESLKGVAAMHPLGRLGKPEEVAYAALFLASDESSFVTGSDIFVDGGYTAQ